MDLTRASKKYQEYCGTNRLQSAKLNMKSCTVTVLWYVTLSSLLLVRKSVEGFRIAVMALANSSWAVLVLADVYGSVLNTY